MAKQAIILGSQGVETSEADMDIIELIMAQEDGNSGILQTIMTTKGWITTAVAKNFEFYAVDDIEISINGRTSFILKAGDEIEESEDLISSFVIITDGAKYRYYAKF